MKNITIIVRILIGLVLLYSSICFFLKLTPEPVIMGNFKVFQIGLWTADYLMPLAKVIELLCGISFISGKFISLANIVILPITVNILLINYFLTPGTLPVAIIIFLGNIYLIYQYWDNYKSVFTP